MNFSPGALLLNTGTRILEVFEKWLTELEAIQHTDFQRATVCLLHIARLLEDGSLMGPAQSVSPWDDENERMDSTLARLFLEDYSEVAYNAFRSMVATTDNNYQNACARVMVVLHMACRDMKNLYLEVFPPNELEEFVTEHINHPNELFRSRIAFLMGEMIMDEKNLPEIPVEEILQPRIQRIKEIRRILESRHEEVIACMQQIEEHAKYVLDISIPIPEPDSPFQEGSIWGTDEASGEGSILHFITVLSGHIHIASALIEFSEALPVAIAEGLVKECIEILKLPVAPIKSFVLILFGNAMDHRKLVIDFIELDGHLELYNIIGQHLNSVDLETYSAHVTYIFQAMFKHSAAVDLLVKPSNAAELVSFMFSLFNRSWDKLGTNLNIMEWSSEAVFHPLLLKEIHNANVWRKVRVICTDLLTLKSSSKTNDFLLFMEHSRSLVTLCSKYIVASLFWGYQYSKSLYSDVEDLKTLNKSVGSLIRKNYVGTSGAIDIVDALVSSPTVIKTDESQIFALEAYVFKSLLRTGHLPKGLTIELFGRSGYVDSSGQTFASSLFSSAAQSEVDSSINLLTGLPSSEGEDHRDMDIETQSVLSMVTKVLPEWTIVASCIQENVIPALFQLMMIAMKDSNLVSTILFCLQLLCVDAAAIVEIMQFDMAKYMNPQIIQENGELGAFQNKKGLEILLQLISSQERRDPTVMIAVLRLLSAMSSSPYFRYNGNDSTVAQGFFEDYLKSPYFSVSQQLAADKKKPFDTAKKQISSKIAYHPLENVQRSVRKSIRANAGISVLTQLLYYKKNVTYAMSIRLETIKILLGLQQDDDIKQILIKLRLPTVLESQNQAEKTQSTMFELNTSPQKFQDKAMLQFYTDNLVNLLRGFPMHQHGQDMGINILDDAQEHLLRKTVVDHSNIEFSQFELLYLIRDHLSAIGLKKSALTLENELIEREQQWNHRNKFYGTGSSSNMKNASSTRHQSSSALPLQKATSVERRLNFAHDVEEVQVEEDNAILQVHEHPVTSLSAGSKKRFRESLDEESRRLEEQHLDTDQATVNAMSSGKTHSSEFIPETNPKLDAKNEEEADEEKEILGPPLKYSTSTKKALNTPAPISVPASVATGSASKRISVHSTPLLTSSIMSRSLHPSLPVAKSQRRKNIANALRADSCSFVVIQPPKGSDSQSVESITSPRAASSSSNDVNAHSVTASRTVSASSTAVVPTNFVTPKTSRYNGHQKSTLHQHNYPNAHTPSIMRSNNLVASSGRMTQYYLPTVETSTPFASTQTKLSSIMRRYLRLQHSQCKHPVSTLPTMSLLKAHSCSKPPPVQFYNANRIVNSYQPIYANAHWMHQNCYDVTSGRLQHLYSSYRTIMTEEDEGYMITSCAFGQQSHRLWLAWYDYDNGAEVTMLDTHTQGTLSDAYDIDIPGMIDSFVFPGMVQSSSELSQPLQSVMCTMIQSHMVSTGQANGKEMYLYRDNDSAEVFRSPPLHQLAITQDDLRHLFSSQPGYSVPNDIVDDDLSGFESAAFSRGTARYLAASMVNDLIPMAAGFVFDIETGIVIHRLMNEVFSSGGPTYEFPQVHYMPDEDQILLLDGKLYDLRTNQTLHRFDKLSRNGNSVFHPTKPDLIIDSAIWDLRMFSLRQTVPLLENCRVQFDRYGGGLIAAKSMKDDDRQFGDIHEEYLGFHVLNPVDYSHIHTQNVVKAGQVSGFGLAEVQVDRSGAGLLAGILLAGAQEATSSQCKVLQIGLRKRTGEDDANDADDDSDVDDEWRETDSDNSEEDEEAEDDEEDDDDDGAVDISVSEEVIDEDGSEDDGHGLMAVDGADEDDDDAEDVDWETEDEGGRDDDDMNDDDDNDDDGNDYETVSDESHDFDDDDDDDDDDDGERMGSTRIGNLGTRSTRGRDQHSHLPTRRGPYSRR